MVPAMLFHVDHVEILGPRPATVVGKASVKDYLTVVELLVQETEVVFTVEAAMARVGECIGADWDQDAHETTRLQDAPVLGKFVKEPFEIALPTPMLKGVECGQFVKRIIIKWHPAAVGNDLHIEHHVGAYARVDVHRGELAGPFRVAVDLDLFGEIFPTAY